MKIKYLDETTLQFRYAIFVNDAQLISAGATVYAMPVSDKNREYERYAAQYDLHFIFEDKVPHIDFYPVPHMDIFATDSHGGYIATIGQTSDMDSEAPICYIDKNRKCFLLAAHFRELLEHAGNWKTKLQPYDGIVFYPSKQAAERELEFVDLEELKELCPPKEWGWRTGVN